MDIYPNSLNGTENAPLLTDKQLAIQRWFASLTYLNNQDDPEGDGWSGYLRFEEYPSQLSNNALRYQLAHLVYATATLTYYKTPAYTQLAANIIKNAIDRMFDYKVWGYVSTYWKDTPTYPDPVIFQNIMYSGHLAQMIALYESISGDYNTYSGSGGGWAFSDNTTSIYYNAQKLMQAMYAQQDKDYTGGVCCEPHGIFIICNNFQHNAFVLYDKLHNTNFSSLNEKWRNFVLAEGLLPEIFSNGDRYLHIVQAQYPPLPRFWEPLGAAGNDGWALSYMLPWWMSNGFDSSFVCKGWQCMHDTRMWQYDNATGGIYISDEWIGHKFDFNDQFTSSFYVLVESQCKEFDKNRKPKSEGVLQYFEKKYGKLLNLRNYTTTAPQVFDGYCYDTGKDYRIMVTAALVMGMVLDGVGDSGLVNVFTNPLIFNQKGKLFLESVHYPQVMVSSAHATQNGNTNLLQFSVKSNDGDCHLNQIMCVGNVNTAVPQSLLVFKNGIRVLEGLSLDKTKLYINTTVCGTTEQYIVQNSM